MNTLIYYSFNIFILMAVILIVGMIKPKWIFFWMDSPGRAPVLVISAVLFMVAATMFGEGNKELQQEKAKQQQPARTLNSEVPDLH
ncbi:MULTISPECIES: hypothetical protein [Methylomonas]|uniref:hypothetical protein n=1 Tax=Methylomonas TaxID=416 RepID=UPI001232A6AE|nr:hypothetical protein [Methylomonas rhizoryzae]